MPRRLKKKYEPDARFVAAHGWPPGVGRLSYEAYVGLTLCSPVAIGVAGVGVAEGIAAALGSPSRAYFAAVASDPEDAGRLESEYRALAEIRKSMPPGFEG